MQRGLFAAGTLVALVAGLPRAWAGAATPTLQVVVGVTATGEATEQWLAMLRKRLNDDPYDAVAPLRKTLTEPEQAWARRIQARAAAWEREIPALAALYAPALPPDVAVIVLGNRGADDAFTHDPTTIGFDLAALQANYGDAELPENAARIDRFFRHEYTHLMQKAWVREHPRPLESPLQLALAEIWAEGLGNYQSLSERWQPRDGERSEAAAAALAQLEPRFVARIAALACAPPERARALTADLSRGRFDQKWGALTAALWLQEEPGPPAEALRRFIVAGPAGVWDLADRHLPDALRGVLREVRATADR